MSKSVGSPYPGELHFQGISDWVPLLLEPPSKGPHSLGVLAVGAPT